MPEHSRQDPTSASRYWDCYQLLLYMHQELLKHWTNKSAKLRGDAIEERHSPTSELRTATGSCSMYFMHILRRAKPNTAKQYSTPKHWIHICFFGGNASALGPKSHKRLAGRQPGPFPPPSADQSQLGPRHLPGFCCDVTASLGKTLDRARL